MEPQFIITGCGRSGTTSLTRILDSSKHTEILIEPTPAFQEQYRWVLKKQREAADLVPEVIEGLRSRSFSGDGSMLRGEKNVTFTPFLAPIQKILDTKIVFIYRDGRDVVKSLLNWHLSKFGTIYREAPDDPEYPLAENALLNSANLPLHLDGSDFGRPRQFESGSPFEDWMQLTRFEMCSYYWADENRRIKQALDDLPEDAYRAIDYTEPTPQDIEEVALWLQIPDLDLAGIKELLKRRINSLVDRGHQSDGVFPDWKNWNSDLRDRFMSIGAGTMELLGFDSESDSCWRPADFGKVWRTPPGELDWYQWMYDSRRYAHADLESWFKATIRPTKKGELKSVCDLGSAYGIGYGDFFSDHEFTGFDLAEKAVNWCRQNREKPGHQYHTLDFMDFSQAQRWRQTFDLVFSQGTIDNNYDVDLFLTRMTQLSRGWIYLTAYRGWFPELDEHRYSWSDTDGCFYNDLSPSRVESTLRGLGCSEIEITPLRTTHGEPVFETRIVAKVAG